MGLRRSGSAEPGVAYGEAEALRQMRAPCPWALVLFSRLVGVAVVHIAGMVAGARWMAWPRPVRRRRWTRPGRVGPGGQQTARCPSQPPLRIAVRVRVLRSRRAFGQCLPGPGAAYLCAGARGGCVATGAHRLPGLRSLLLRDPCVRTQGHRVAGLCVCAAPGGASDSPTPVVDGQTVCGSGSRQDFQRVRGHRGRARGGNFT